MVVHPTGREELGRRVRARRKELGLTLAVAAERAEVSLPYLSDVERGTRLPSLDVLARIANSLGCLAIDLLEGVAPYGASDNPQARRKGQRSGRKRPP